jgi:hypothetical protein
MSSNLRRIAVVIGAALALGSIATAMAGQTDLGRFHLGVATKQPDSATALRFRILYGNPDDRGTKPTPVTGAVFTLPRGLRIDTTAVPQCDAEEPEIRALGRAACPAGSQVGEGRLIARTGVPGADRVKTDVVVFNGAGELIEIVFVEGTNTVAGFDRITVEDNVLTAHPPETPGGPPDGRTAVQKIFLELPERLGTEGLPYVTTPPACRSGKWKASADYEFADGTATTVPSRTRCEAPASG